MLRRNLHSLQEDGYMHPSPIKPLQHSISTSESDSPRLIAHEAKPSMRQDKEKSQLCKKFIEFGYCPYKSRCKFAHGSHQLRKNHQFNSKYKTKECGVFLTEGCCQFGERCNFIHKGISRKDNPDQTQFHMQFHDSVFQEIKAEGRIQSRLLGILHCNEDNGTAQLLE